MMGVPSGTRFKLASEKAAWVEGLVRPPVERWEDQYPSNCGGGDCCNTYDVGGNAPPGWLSLWMTPDLLYLVISC